MTNDLDLRPANHLGWKIAAFLASLALAFAGTINAVTAFTAYLGGSLVDAVGSGADKALADTADEVPKPDAVVSRDDIKSVSSSAHSFSLKAKLLGLAIGAVAAIELLAGALVRKRYRSLAIPTILGLAIAGEVVVAILLKPSILNAIGIGAALFGLLIWTKAPKREPQMYRSGWGALHEESL